MNMSDWKKLEELSYNFYDTIDFTPYFTNECWMDIDDIMEKIEDYYYKHQELLPKELEGEFFDAISAEEFALYLKKRYNLHFSWKTIDKYYVSNPSKI